MRVKPTPGTLPSSSCVRSARWAWARSWRLSGTGSASRTKALGGAVGRGGISLDLTPLCNPRN